MIVQWRVSNNGNLNDQKSKDKKYLINLLKEQKIKGENNLEMVGVLMAGYFTIWLQFKFII